MTFKDIESGDIFTDKDLFMEWEDNHKTDPETYQETFSAYMINIIMATVNGRNDLDIVDMTAKEIDKVLNELKRKEGIR